MNLDLSKSVAFKSMMRGKILNEIEDNEFKSMMSPVEKRTDDMNFWGWRKTMC